MANKMTYKDSGVDIDLGDRCSKIMYEAARKTWANRKNLIGEVMTPFDDFSGLRYIDMSHLKDAGMNLNLDGVGTKMEIAERLSTWTGDYSYHQGIAFDLLAMVCDDAVVRGAEPVLVGSILDVNILNAVLIENLAEGMVKAAREARVAVVNGEIAELGDRISGYGEYNYNWGAVVVWMARTDSLITGHDVTSGDAIVSLQEQGFRSNGLSLFRNIMLESYGGKWHEKEFRGENIAKLALTPSRIYSSFIIDLIGGYGREAQAEVKAIAHITGGGIPGKLGRVLRPSGCGATLTDPFEPPDLMLHCQKLGRVDDEEAYRTWNMGNGMLIITDQPEQIMRMAADHAVEANIAGEVTRQRGIRITNKGYFSEKTLQLDFDRE
jgi:phosphoribosylformylglycinamidine cyclo-ligase